MRAIVIHRGSDGPTTTITFVNGRPVIKVDPGWNPEQRAELVAALNIISEATKLKTPGLATAAIESVMEFAQKQLNDHVQDGAVLVV